MIKSLLDKTKALALMPKVTKVMPEYLAKSSEELIELNVLATKDMILLTEGKYEGEESEQDIQIKSIAIPAAYFGTLGITPSEKQMFDFMQKCEKEARIKIKSSVADWQPRQIDRWLPHEAIQFLKDNVKYQEKMLPDIHGDLHKISVPVKVVVGTYGTFNRYELSKYHLKNGNECVEFYQLETGINNTIKHFIGLRIFEDKSEPVEMIWTDLK